MTKELGNAGQSFYTQQSSLALEHEVLELKDINPFALVGPYDSTIASCKDYPLPSHAAKSLFVEPEHESNAGPVQELQQKQKENFLKRLSLANLKKQMAALFTKDTITSWSNKIGDFFAGNKPKANVGASSKTVGVPAKKVGASEQNKVEKTQEAALASHAPVSDLNKKRIKEIEEASAAFEAELHRYGGGNMNAMIELAGKILIMLGALGIDLNKKNINEYIKYLETNVKQRVETYNRRRIWTYISIGFNIAAAGASVVGIFGAKEGLRLAFAGIGKIATPFSYLGEGANKLDNIDEQKYTGERTEKDHIGEKLKQFRRDLDESNQKITGTNEKAIEAWRNMNAAYTEAKKRTTQ
jgi:hypothetical protein